MNNFLISIQLFFFIACNCQQIDISIGSKSGGSLIQVNSFSSVSQSFVATGSSISKIRAWVTSTNSTITLELSTSLGGNAIGRSTTFINGNNNGFDFLFPMAIQVTVGNTYFATISTNSSCTWTGDSIGVYSEGSAFTNSQVSTFDLWMNVYSGIITLDNSVYVPFNWPNVGGASTPIGSLLSQSFVTKCDYITGAYVGAFPRGNIANYYIYDSNGGNLLGSASLINFTTTYIGNFTVNFVPPIKVTPYQTYWLLWEASGDAGGSSAWLGTQSEVYLDGALWGYTSNTPGSVDFYFGTYGYLAPPNPLLSGCTEHVPNSQAPSTCTNNVLTEVNIYKPTSYLNLCSFDFLLKEVKLTADITFVVYESAAENVNSTYNLIYNVTRSTTSGNIITKLISDSINLRIDRYYAIGWSSTVSPFHDYSCGGVHYSPYLDLISSRFLSTSTSFGNTFDFTTLQTGNLRLYLRFYLENITAPISTGSMTSGLITTGEITSGINTSGRITSGLITTGTINTSGRVTSGLITSGINTSGRITSGEFTTGEITSGRVTTGEVTSGTALTSSNITSAEITTSVSNSASSSTTAQVPITSGHITSSPVISAGESDNYSKSRDQDSLLLVAIGVGIAAGLLTIIVIALLIISKRKQKKPKAAPKKPEPVDLEMLKRSPTTDSVHAQTKLPIIKNIEVKKKLSEGNFGEIYLGVWNGTKVALKGLKDKEKLDEFAKEINTLKEVIHPNCVQFLGIYAHESGFQYIVTEYLPLGSLKSFLKEKEKSLTIIDLLHITIGAAKGMAYLESISVLHRDVALRNLLAAQTNGKYTSKVSDFGLSRATSTGSYQPDKKAMVPVKWTSPEVLKGHPATIKNDVWAFGITMWEIFTFGSEPFSWLSVREAATEIPKGERPGKPADCPTQVFKVMEKCWDLNPLLRPSFITIVGELKAVKKEMLKVVPELRTSTSNREVNDTRDNEYQAEDTYKIITQEDHHYLAS